MPERTVTRATPPTTPGNVLVRHGNVIAGGRRVAYVDAGEGGTACLLIHGLSASSRFWSENIPALAVGRRTIAIDLPGFGESEGARSYDPLAIVDVIAEICDELGLEEVDIVGHSMGTLLGCEFARRFPHRLRRLVLTGGPITSVLRLFHSPVRTLRKRPRVANFLIEVVTAGIPLPARLRKFIARHPTLRLLALKPFVFDPRRLEPRHAETMLSGVGARGTFPTLAGGFRYEAEPAMAGLDCPMLVIGGAKDNIAPIEDLEEFAAAESVERFVALDSTGHCPMLEKPDEFNREVLEFLA